MTSTIVLLNSHSDRPYVPDVVVERMQPIYAPGRHDLVERYVPIYETGLQEVVEARAIDAMWIAALGMLQAQLADLPDVEVTGLAAPAEPWAPVAWVKRGRAIAALRDALGAPAGNRKNSPQQ